MIIIMSVGFVSAGFLDFIFGDKDAGSGELDVSKPVSASLTVSGQYEAPDVVYINDITDRSLTQGANTAKSFEISVYSSAGVNALPSTTSSPVLSASNVYVTLVYTGTNPATQPGGKQIKSTAVCTITSLSTTHNVLTDDITNNNGYCSSASNICTVRKYSCTVNVPYYANYGSTTNKNWDVRAYVQDLSPTPNEEGFKYTDGIVETWVNNVDNVPAGTGVHVFPIRQTWFSQLIAWDITPIAIDFGTVGFDDTLDRQPTAITQPVIKNKGNIDIDKTSLQGSNLQDNPTPTDDVSYIDVTWFYSHPTTPCDTSVAINLDTTLKEVMQDNIAYGLSGTTTEKNLGLCLKKILAGAPTSVTSQAYSTTYTGGTPWNVDTINCANPGCV